jgi:hypothetical protein
MKAKSNSANGMQKYRLYEVRRCLVLLIVSTFITLYYKNVDYNNEIIIYYLSLVSGKDEIEGIRKQSCGVITTQDFRLHNFFIKKKAATCSDVCKK